MSSVGSKTPVSILHEYFVSKGITPSFQCIEGKGRAHMPTFTYRVTAGEYYADGSGPSKQKAKHEAAQQLLNLIQSEIHNEPEHRGSQLKTVLQVLSCPQENCLNINAVGNLADYCFKTNNPEPKYVDLRADGPPHQPVFTCECSVSTISALGEARTKKEAKHKSAYNMLIKLKDMYNDTSNELILPTQLTKLKAEQEAIQAERDEKADELYFSHANRSRPIVTASTCMSHYRAYSNLLGLSPTLRKCLHDIKEILEEPFNNLKKIAQESQIELVVNEIRSESGAINSVIVKMSYVLPLIRNGIDANDGSRRVLETLIECIAS